MAKELKDKKFFTILDMATMMSCILRLKPNSQDQYYFKVFSDFLISDETSENMAKRMERITEILNKVPTPQPMN
jgi:hypothetical protein